MGNLKIKLTGARELMCSDEIHDIVAEHGRAIMARLPADGYEMTERRGAKRWNVQIAAHTQEAIKDCLANDTLLKAVGSGD